MKNSRQMSWWNIKIDPSHLQEKWASSIQNFTQIAVFLALFELYFSSEPNLSFLFALIFDSIPVFKPDFCMSQKSLRQICKSGISLKYALTNCVFYFSICIMVLISNVYSTKKRNNWIQYLSNFKLVKFNFKLVYTSSFILISRQDQFLIILSLPPLHFFSFQLIYGHPGKRTNLSKNK